MRCWHVQHPVSKQPTKNSSPPKAPAQLQQPASAKPACEVIQISPGSFLRRDTMPLQLQRGDIAGAVVAVVKDGEVIFAPGGNSICRCRGQETRFDGGHPLPSQDQSPNSLPGLPSCNSAQQGKLDLDRDVNDYLDFKILRANLSPEPDHATLHLLPPHFKLCPGNWPRTFFVKDATDAKLLSTISPTTFPIVTHSRPGQPRSTPTKRRVLRGTSSSASLARRSMTAQSNTSLIFQLIRDVVHHLRPAPASGIKSLSCRMVISWPRRKPSRLRLCRRGRG